MILARWTFALILGLAAQAGGPSSESDSGLTAAEKEQLQKEQKIDSRIKIYETASTRLFKALEANVLKEDFQSVPACLKTWTSLLDLAVEDINANASRKKKSKALIRYEIQLRKALADVQGFKIRAPVDEQDEFDAFLNRAEEIRKKFVDILFPG